MELHGVSVHYHAGFMLDDAAVLSEPVSVRSQCIIMTVKSESETKNQFSEPVYVKSTTSLHKIPSIAVKSECWV